MKFKDKHFIITGASSGIGKQVALQLAAEGARITGIARNKELLYELYDQLQSIHSVDHKILILDLSLNSKISTIVDDIDTCDGIVHAAGIVLPIPVKYIKQKHIDQIFNINFSASVILTSTLLSRNLIKNNGSIVFVSSISTKHPYFGGALYISSKAALEAYSRSLALELAIKKIRSNVVSPALVKTKIFEETIAASDDEKLKEYEKKYLLGFGEPVDVANAILFLLSSSSRWMTGQEIVLDGGLTLSSQ